MKINPRHLSYIVEASLAGSIRAAAKNASISEPAISAAIGIIEEHVGYPIFVRSTSKGIHLTPRGKRFVDLAVNLLDQISSFEQSVCEESRNIRGPVRIGCYLISAPFMIASVLERSAALNPDLDLSIVEGTLEEVIQDLKEGRTDLAFSYDAFHDSALSYDVLFEVFPHVILGSKDPLSAESFVSLKDLNDKPCAVLDLPLSSRESEFMNVFKACGIKPNIKYKVKNFEMIRSIVGANLAYSFGRLPIRPTRSYDGRIVVQKPLKDNVPKFRMCIVYPKNLSGSPVVKYFSHISKSVVRDHGVSNGNLSLGENRPSEREISDLDWR